MHDEANTLLPLKIRLSIHSNTNCRPSLRESVERQKQSEKHSDVCMIRKPAKISGCSFPSAGVFFWVGPLLLLGAFWMPVLESTKRFHISILKVYLDPHFPADDDHVGGSLVL